MNPWHQGTGGSGKDEVILCFPSLLLPHSTSLRHLLGRSGQNGTGYVFSITKIFHYRMKTSEGVGESESHSVMSDSVTPWTIHSSWNFLGQNTGVDSLSLLQRTFPTQELNRGLLHCSRIPYQLSYQGSPEEGG